MSCGVLGHVTLSLMSNTLTKGTTQLSMSVTFFHIFQVAKKVLGGKSSLAVVGDLHQTPYLDEL